MNCRLDDDMVQQYLDGTLSPLERSIFEEHLRVCEDCRRELREYKLLFWELKELEKFELHIPAEVSAIKARVIRDFADSRNAIGFDLKTFIKTQTQIYKRASTFLQFVPGVNASAAYVDRNIKKVPSLLYKAMGGVLHGGGRLILSRIRT